MTCTVAPGSFNAETFDIRIRNVYPGDAISVYKVVGDESSIYEYFDAVHDNVAVAQDWSAMYFQFSAEHAVGTLGYRWDQGYSVATLIRLKIFLPEVIVAFGSAFCSPHLSGEEKASILKMKLDIDQNDILMSALGQRNVCLCCQESDLEWELIIPHKMRGTLDISEEVVCQYQSNGFGGTRHVRMKQNGVWGAWERYIDPLDVKSVPPDEWTRS